MKTKLKSNKLILVILILVCIIFVLSPKVYANCCFNALSVWAVSVLPTLLPFFILTRLIVNLSGTKPNKMDKFFKKVYHTNNSASVWFLSILSGYPMGAKLICNMYDLGRIDKTDAKKMLSFCSVSGPMFIVGTVGVGFLFSFKAGLVILIANILACLINGLIYRGKAETEIKSEYVPPKKNENLLYDCVYDAMISVLMVGAFIVLSFLIIEVLINLKILTYFSNAISNIFNLNSDVVLSILKGTIEITRGTLDLGKTSISLYSKTIIASGLVAFGGISVMMQSVGFLAKLKIPVKTMFLQKITQAILCVIITIMLAWIFI